MGGWTQNKIIHHNLEDYISSTYHYLVSCIKYQFLKIKKRISAKLHISAILKLKQ